MDSVFRVRIRSAVIRDVPYSAKAMEPFQYSVVCENGCFAEEVFRVGLSMRPGHPSLRPVAGRKHHYLIDQTVLRINDRPWPVLFDATGRPKERKTLALTPPHQSPV